MEMHALWKEYSSADDAFRQRLLNAHSRASSFVKGAAEILIEHGIVCIDGLFNSQDLDPINTAIDEWKSSKAYLPYSQHLSFDGNSGETKLSESKELSKMVTNSTVRNIVEYSFGQPCRMAFNRTYLDQPKPSYQERAYYPHHDGYSHVGLKVMILLNDVAPNGLGMRFCPGTHQAIWPTKSSFDTKFSLPYWNLFKKLDCWGPAGRVFIFNPNAVHSGSKLHPSCSDVFIERRVVVTNFQPGPIRNYGVSPLHKEVAEKLTAYELYVFRKDPGPPVPRVGDSEEAWETALREHRVHAKQLHDHTKDTSMLDSSSSKTSLSLEIARISMLNQITLQNSSPELVSGLSRSCTGALSESSFEEEHARRRKLLISSDIVLQPVPFSAVVTLLHADLDLPIRMYHPLADQTRDSAITAIRDGNINMIISSSVKKLLEEFNMDQQRFLLWSTWDELCELAGILQNYFSTKITSNSRRSGEPVTLYALGADLVEIFVQSNSKPFLVFQPTCLWLGIVLLALSLEDEPAEVTDAGFCLTDAVRVFLRNAFTSLIKFG